MGLSYLGPIIRSGTGIPIEWESEGKGGHNGMVQGTAGMAHAVNQGQLKWGNHAKWGQ